MHIYAFGSICRGDLSLESDIDLLAIVDGFDERFDPTIFSIYSYRRIRELWAEGNPFAWHLSREARPLYLSDRIDYLRDLGSPCAYRNCAQDCEKFLALFSAAQTSLETNRKSDVFDLSIAFLSMRNIATCFSLGTTDNPDFSRHSAAHLGIHAVPISPDAYRIFERSRILCTRGTGTQLTELETQIAIRELSKIREWMEILVKEARDHERIQ